MTSEVGNPWGGEAAVADERSEGEGESFANPDDLGWAGEEVGYLAIPSIHEGEGGSDGASGGKRNNHFSNSVEGMAQ